MLNVLVCFTVPHCRCCKFSAHQPCVTCSNLLIFKLSYQLPTTLYTTVDGRSPAPHGMYKTLYIMGKITNLNWYRISEPSTVLLWYRISSPNIKSWPLRLLGDVLQMVTPHLPRQYGINGENHGPSSILNQPFLGGKYYFPKKKSSQNLAIKNLRPWVISIDGVCCTLWLFQKLTLLEVISRLKMGRKSDEPKKRRH